MKLRNSIVYFSTILLLLSCTEKKWVNEVVVDSSVKENAIHLLSTEQRQTLQHVYAKRMDVYRDSILIVLNKPNNEVKMVEFYNLKTGVKISDYISFGNGNGEMLNSLSHLRGNSYEVDDFIKKNIVSINIDSVLHNPNYKIPMFSPYTTSSQFITFFKDDSFININRYCFQNKELGIKNSQDRFIVEKQGEKMIDDKKYNNVCDAFNVTQGFLIINEKQDRVLFFSGSLAEIEVYNMNLSHIKKIVGPDRIEPIYALEENSVYYRQFIPLGYVEYCTDGQDIFVLYVGCGSLDEFEKPKGTYIFKMDWDGNLVKSYFVDKQLSTISKSSDENVFYAGGLQGDGLNVVYKLVVDEKI